MFNIKRFTKYIRYDLNINGKTYSLALLAVFCLLVITFYFFLIEAYKQFGDNQYEPLMVFGMVITGVIFIGGAFPAFRNKQKSVNYLTLPVSQMEKFLWEFLLKVPIFLMVYLSVFWLAFETAERVFRITRPQDMLTIGDFRFFEIVSGLGTDTQLLVYLGILSIAALLLAGSTFFRKYAPLKILLSIGALLFATFVFMVILSHLFFPEMLNHTIEIDFPSYRTFGIMSNSDMTIIVLTACSSLFLLPLSYWLLKEKEL